jgi:hypothetical protein
MKTKQKNRMRLFTLALILVTSSFYFSCSSEEQAVSSEHGPNKDLISFDQFKNATNIRRLDPTVSIQRFNPMSRDINPEEFVVDTLAILTAIKDGKITYTFRIYPTTFTAKEKEVFNLVYRKESGVWETSIVSYITKTVENTKLCEEIKTEYDSKLMQNSVIDFAALNGICYADVYSIMCDGSCSGECDGFACPTGQCIRHRVVTVACSLQSSISDGNGDSGGGGEAGGTGGTGGGGETGGGETGGGASGTNPEYEFNPNTYDAQDHNFFFGEGYGSDAVAIEFYLSLPQEIKNWRNDGHNSEYLNVQNYYVAHHNEPNALQFANQLLQQMIQMPGVRLDATASANSPFNVDISGLGSSQAEEKFKSIYNKLMQSPTFKDLFTNMFDVTTFINAKLQVADLPQTGPDARLGQ